MDWIEEQVEKIKQYIKDAKLERSLICCLLVSVAAAVVLFIFTRNICYGWITVLEQRYPEIKDEAAIVLTLLQFFYYYNLIFYLLIAMIVAVRIFSRRKLYTAVESINTAVGYLIQGDYSHEPVYQSHDELGMVCKRMEELRQRLLEEKRRQWRSDEGQRSINSAFAHDMRTPLTVMMGYTEFLLKYVPKGKVSEPMMLEKLDTMYKQQVRLLEFSKTMTEVQHMELRELHCKKYQLSELKESLKKTVNELEKQSGIQIYIEQESSKNYPEYTVSSGNEEISADFSLVLEVCENLLSNALRYAKHEIRIVLKLEEKSLTIFVKDDGNGFSPKGLREASELYYSESKGEEGHFGMGLYICRTLCEKHGGTLSIINGVEGGAIVAATVRV